MVINLCRNSDAVAGLVNASYSGCRILDIAGVINDFPNVLRISSLDENGELEIRAIKKYVDFIGSVSRIEIDNTNIRDFKFCDHPLFWFTQLAEKHDSYHWGKDAWLLYTLLIEKTEIFAQRSTIFISADYAHIAVLLEEFFRLAELERPTIIYIGKKSSHRSKISYFLKYFILFVKAVLLKMQLLFKKGKKVHFLHKNVFIFNDPGIWKNEIETNSGTGAVFNLSSGITESIGVPLMNSFNSFHYNWNDIDDDFILSAPSLNQLFGLFRNQLKTLKRLKKKSQKICIVGKAKIPFDLLCEEMLSVDYFDLLNLLWFSNYFRKIDNPVKIFYQNEFYIYGRIVSAAARTANNNYVSTYGMQHGLVLENHTVYHISDLELQDLKKGDGVPMPDFFITWGTYFGELFLSGNSISPQYTIAAGNLKYHQIIKERRTPANKGKRPKLLWCTTLPNLFKAEYAIIRNVLEEMDNYELCFRLHPGKHMQKEDLISWVSNKVMAKSTFSNHSDIFDDIAEYDIIISTVFSTAFFDALVMNKKTCRIFTGLSKADFSNVNIENLYDIKTSFDFRRIFDCAEKKNRDLPSVSIDSLCYLKDDVWRKLLAHD